MGLDITAYEHLTLKKAITLKTRQADEWADEEEGENNGWVFLYDTAWRGDGLKEGWYKPEGERYRFRAGSYGGYNGWRTHLCQAMLDVSAKALWETQEHPLVATRFLGKPFVELINFSDCEGVIGPRTSKKLATDFAEHKDKFAATLDPKLTDFGYAESYDDWTKAFALASETGAVHFS